MLSQKRFKFSDYRLPGDLNLRRDRSKAQFASWGKIRVIADKAKLTTLDDRYAEVLFARHTVLELIGCHDCKVMKSTSSTTALVEFSWKFNALRSETKPFKS